MKKAVQEFLKKAFSLPTRITPGAGGQTMQASAMATKVQGISHWDLELLQEALDMESLTGFQKGDLVKKVKGYEFSGVVVASFLTLAGKKRYVVECTVPGAGGMLHIYNETVLDYNN